MGLGEAAKKWDNKTNVYLHLSRGFSAVRRCIVMLPTRLLRICYQSFDLSNSFGPPLAKQNLRTNPKKLWVSQEPELYTCPLAGRQTLPFLDFENIGILHDAVDIDCALEARLHPAVGVVQHVDVCLKLPAFVAGLVHLELRREKHSSLAKRKVQ